MITRHGMLDAEGWVRGVRVAEGRRPLLPTAVPLSEEEAHRTATLPFHHGPSGLELAQDDRVAWKALRKFGRSGPDAFAALDRVREYRAAVPHDLSVAVEDPPPLMALAPPAVDAFADVPGLTLEPMRAAHLDAAAAIAIGAGLAPATCPDGTCVPPEAHAWLQLASRLDHLDQWQFALSFQGRPLQYEVIVFDPLRTTATFSITYHTSAGRERPSWFHHEAEQPVFAAMQQLGIRTLVSRTRADRPDWIASLEARYGAVDTGPLSGGTIRRLAFPLDLTRFAGWPPRKQVGLDQVDGTVRTWEATAADLPAVRQLITDTVPVGQRAIALRVLDEWYHLDRATLLLGAKDGALRYARTLRLRKPGQASLAIVGALFDEPEQAQVTAAIRTWCQQAGYTTVSSFVPERLLASGNMQAQLARAGTRVVRTRTDLKEVFMEMEMTV